MKKIIGLFLLVGAMLPYAVQASWYWPFGSDEDEEPPRLHRLLEPANDIIEQAEDAALDGDATQAVELYKKALEELERVARENPARAQTPEFAPLRNKMATVQAALDSIRFAQVKDTSKAVAITDTHELEVRLAVERGKLPPSATNEFVKAKKDVTKPADAEKEEPKAEPQDDKKPAEAKPAETKPAEAKPAEVKPPEAKPAETKAPEAKPAEQKPAAEKPVDPSKLDFKGKMSLAIQEIRARDFTAADILLEELVIEKPNDLNVLILRAAAQTGLGSYYAARRTLEKAHRAHPKSYLPCYNLAYLMFKIPGDNSEDARQYYELGRGLGGPRDAKLEEKLK